jgi:hypothetical protein
VTAVATASVETVLLVDVGPIAPESDASGVTLSCTDGSSGESDFGSTVGLTGAESCISPINELALLPTEA